MSFSRMSREELYARTGIQFMDFNSLFQLDTLIAKGCSALEDAEKILFIPDALTYMLTGSQICEYTVASTSQMLNVRTKDFDPEILATLGIGNGQVEVVPSFVKGCVFGNRHGEGLAAKLLSAQYLAHIAFDDRSVVVVHIDTQRVNILSSLIELGFFLLLKQARPILLQ